MADEQSDKTQVSRPAAVDYGTLQPGAAIGRYEVVSVLGQGGFGITYRARDTQLERDVAIKEYLPSALAIRHDGATVVPRSTQTADDFVWGRARFLDEAKIMARFADAPAVVRVHEFLETNGTVYVVMPLLRGETLEARLRREQRLPQPAIERMLYPLLDGLRQVHAAGFLHRDIKPGNIILADDGAPTLIDFGASREAVQGRTQSITAVFTPGFAPIEQLTSGKQGPWTDIYALAATLYACVAGKPPTTALERMVGTAVAPAAEIGKGSYAPSLLAAIDAGLAVKAEQRPQSIDEWRHVLATGVWAKSADDATTAFSTQDDAATRRSAPPPSSPAPPLAPAAAPPPPRRPMALWLVLASVVLAAAGGGAWWALSPKPTELALAPKRAPVPTAAQPPAPAAVLPAAAAPNYAQLRSRCFDGASPDQRLEGCTAVIDGGHETPESLADAFRIRGNVYRDRSQYETAVKDYDQAIKLKPDMYLAYFERGLARTRNGQHDLAIPDYDQTLKLKPDFPPAFHDRGIAYLHKGQYDRAIQDFDQAIKLKPDYPLALNSRGLAYLHKGQYDRAIQDFDQAIKLNPTYTDAINNRRIAGEKLAAAKPVPPPAQPPAPAAPAPAAPAPAAAQPPAPAPAPAPAAAQPPAAAPNYAQLRSWCYERANFDQRLEGCAAVIDGRREPPESLAEAFRNRGIAYAGKSQFDRAIQDYDQAIKLKPDSSPAYFDRGIAHFRKGQYDLSIQDYDQAIRLKPDNAYAYNNRGNDYQLKGQYDRAIQDFDQAIKLNPNYLFALNNRGKAYMSKGQFDRAVQDFDQAIKLNPNYTEAISNRRVASEKLAAQPKPR